MSKPRVAFEFEVEKILGISTDGNFQVQWAPAWVSKSHLVGCEHLIQEFLQRQDENINEPGILIEPAAHQINEDSKHEAELLSTSAFHYETNPLESTSVNSGDNTGTINGHHVHIPVETTDYYQKLLSGDVLSEGIKLEQVEEEDIDNAGSSLSINAPLDELGTPSATSISATEVANGDDRETYNLNVKAEDKLEETVENTPRTLPFSTSSLFQSQCSTLSADDSSISEEVHTDIDATGNQPEPTLLNSIATDISATDYATDISQDSLHRKPNENSPLDVDSASSHHPSSSSTHFTCNTCKQEFSSQSFLDNHLKKHSAVKEHVCSYCDKKFRWKNELTRHLSIHTGNFNFSCTLCPYKSSKKSRVINHNRIHTGEKPFECEECGKLFRCKSNLKAHEKIHTGDRPFSCTYCESRFVRSSDLAKHLRIHTGERPFCCHVCQKSYTRKSHLNDHMKVHT